ncbi:vWA domain-containing protein [Myceligenerans indicum]|uniref:VWA domain-containing protein n=1 Tax=Myceligenerans indicum TaxID=2593663 RepID=A0ABS1LEZ4_9MICO|nr:VWA domain-containing protein [Myceligenerans indicum]MBL0884831.1 VWA domain-containing protein [Myceligenerans indicum]
MTPALSWFTVPAPARRPPGTGGTRRPRVRGRLVPVVVAVSVAVSLAACTPGPAVSSADAGGATTAPSPPNPIPELVPVEYDAPRELTGTERLMLYRPGPFAGDAFDEDAVVETVLAMTPETPAEWERAILGQVHGDYVAALRGTVEFEYAIDGPGAGPDQERGPAGPVGTNHFALLLDASGSMARPSGEGTRMDEAKEALRQFVARLPREATVSLRVYGDAGDATAEGRHASCRSSRVVYDDEADEARFARALDDVEPGGWTPLARAVRTVAHDVPDDATDAIVYLVTDGLETCGGDPVAATRALADGGVEPVVNVIGFQAGNADQEGLRRIADAGGGAYTAAADAAALTRYLDREYARMMDAWDAWRRAELERIDDAGRAHLAEAERYGATLMEAAEDEGRAGMDVTRELGDRGALDDATESAVWEYFLDRKNELWRYGYDTKAANWGDAYRERVRDWGQVYRTATSRWSDYYRRAYQN